MSLFNKITKSFQWGDKTVVMETGEIARQASGAVIVNIEDTVVLATVGYRAADDKYATVTLLTVTDIIQKAMLQPAIG